VTAIGVLGTYDSDPKELFRVDLMRYLSAHGCEPSIIVFRTGGAPRPEAPLNALHCIGDTRSVLQVSRFDDPAAIDAIQQLGLDVLVYAGGRDILRPGVIEAAGLGCLGGHYGPLPAVRGMGTVEWSVLTGRPIVVAIQRLARGVDTGDIIMQAPVSLRSDDTFASIRNRCYYWLKVMMAVSVRALIANPAIAVPQRLEDGDQYFRLHRDVIALAERRLADRLKMYARHPWVPWPGASR
jgi:methionyl-tRNA formyltransferase